jgi:deoxyribose-phosphate aldolase
MSLVKEPAQLAQHSKIIGLLDLTQLEDNLSASDIIQLCKRGITPLGNVAAVCIPAKFVSCAKEQLQGTQIKVATVVNFPLGDQPLADIIADIATIIETGADEIDIVIPYKLYLAQQTLSAKPFLQAFRKACPAPIGLKLILETGELREPSLIQTASVDALEAGADFIKTSTGKTAVGATLAAAEIMLKAIKNVTKANDVQGFKASGGIKTVVQAQQYLQLASQIMGDSWVSPQTFRFGASSLLNDLLQTSAGNSNY